MCRAHPLLWPTPGRLGAFWIRKRTLFLCHPGPVYQHFPALGEMEVSARTFRARQHVDRAPNGSRAFSSRSELAPRFVWGRLVPAELPHPGHAFISLHVRRIVRLVSRQAVAASRRIPPDRKSTRLNSSHLVISYAVFCL